jgi:hypothetical protein
MVEKVNVLIFPSGSEIGMEIFESLKYNIHFTLFGMTSRDDHSRYLYDDEHLLMGDYNIQSNSFIKALENIILSYNIKYIFPTHDTVVEFLAINREKLSATVIGSGDASIIARSKAKTYDMLRGYDFMPKMFENITDITPDEYPVFVRPDRGQGGKGAFRAESFDELNTKIYDCDDELIVNEYLEGDEISVDCFSNCKNELLFIGARTRERIGMGISFRSTCVAPDEEITNIAKTLNSVFNIHGAWFFQLKKNRKGAYKFLEFALRQASTMGLYRQLGVNFAALALFDAMGLNVRILFNDVHIQLDRRLQCSYKLDIRYSTIFIDFDDTIIISNKVNTTAMSFLYQCHNKGKKVVLLTKHAFDINKTLKLYRVPENLFNEIIHLKPDDEKYKYIDRQDAIFIDNYYFDRVSVHEQCGIPVFDVDAIASLIDNT